MQKCISRVLWLGRNFARFLSQSKCEMLTRIFPRVSLIWKSTCVLIGSRWFFGFDFTTFHLSTRFHEWPQFSWQGKTTQERFCLCRYCLSKTQGVLILHKLQMTLNCLSFLLQKCQNSFVYFRTWKAKERRAAGDWENSSCFATQRGMLFTFQRTKVMLFVFQRTIILQFRIHQTRWIKIQKTHLYRANLKLKKNVHKYQQEFVD